MDDDQLNHTTVLRDLRDSMTGLTMPEPPHLNAVTGRGHARRRRRRTATTGLSLAGLAAGTGLVLALTGVLTPARGLGTIRTAAFTITGHPNGTATLSINASEVFDPAALQADLAKYGIPALVNSGSFCTTSPAPDGFSQVVSIRPPFSEVNGHQLANPTVTINPAALPDGTELSFGVFPFGNYTRTAMTLITTSSYTCSSAMPTALPPGGALLNWYTAAGS